MAAGERDNLEREEIRVFCNKEDVVSCSSSSISKWKPDRMGEIELDAARALADFAQMALLESGNSSGFNWGNKGRRSKKRDEWGKKRKKKNKFEEEGGGGCKVKCSPSDEVVQGEKTRNSEPLSLAGCTVRQSWNDGLDGYIEPALQDTNVMSITNSQWSLDFGALLNGCLDEQNASEAALHSKYAWVDEEKSNSIYQRNHGVARSETHGGSFWSSTVSVLDNILDNDMNMQLYTEESTVEDNQWHKKMRITVTSKAIKAEQDLEMPKSTPQCSTSCVSSGGGRSKHQLTEAEKEAKRLRRILANRESARQTIRRRQAMCEELTRKEADLVLENETLEREKQRIMKEYLLLKQKNEHLKAQIARSIKTEEEVLSTPAKAVETSPEKQQQALVYTGPSVTPLVWSPIIPPLNPIQTQPLLRDSLVPACKIESLDELRNLPSANGLGPPFYIMPCPWFFPVGNGLYPHPLDSFGLTNKQDDTCCDEGSSPKVTEDVENHQPSFSRNAVTDTKSPNNLPDTTIRLAPGEDTHLAGSHPSMNHMPSSLKLCEPAMAVKCENMFQEDSTLKEESGSSTSSRTNAFPDNVQGHNVYHSKKMVDAALAAEARKRRKELTRLKNLNGRQLRLQC